MPDRASKLSRHEDRRLITGAGRFTADVDLPGQLHAAMVRSDRAHARILSLDVAEARRAEGVVAVLTAADVDAAGFKPLPIGGALKGADGEPQRTAPMPVLAGERVRFVGQPIAMVIAGSALQARDAAERVEVAYEELPLAATVDAALAADAPQLHESVPGNLALVFEDGDEDAVDQAFSRAAKVSTLRIRSQRLVGSPLELRACVAAHDPERGVTVIHTPTQGMLGMRASLHAVTGWPDTAIEVAPRDVGGSFGIRGGTFPEQVLTMLAARTLGRPVKWVASRSELFIGEWHGRALTLQGSVALDAAGDILALRFEHETDLGAYSCYWGSLIGTKNLAVTMGGVYRVPALHMRSRLVYTNTVPVSAYRRRGPAGYRLHHRAADRPRRGRARPRPGRAAPPELRAERGLPLPHRQRHDLRLRGFRGRDGRTRCDSRGTTISRARRAASPRRADGCAASASPATWRLPAAAPRRATRSPAASAPTAASPSSP